VGGGFREASGGFRVPHQIQGLPPRHNHAPIHREGARFAQAIAASAADHPLRFAGDLLRVFGSEPTKVGRFRARQFFPPQPVVDCLLATTVWFIVRTFFGGHCLPAQVRRCFVA
jgi:hypothetical protein